jgi:hypothetical protein
MIVWGGYSGASLNDGGQYDPVGNAWTATTTTAAPSVRYDHTAVWTGSRMIVWGGFNTVPLNDGGQYNPGTTPGTVYSPIVPEVLGGAVTVSNYTPSPWLAHFHVLGQVHRLVKHLPIGTPITRITTS